MRPILAGAMAVSMLATGAATAQVAARADAMTVAIASGVCGDAGVQSAQYEADGNISAICNDDQPTAFLPLAGGLAPLVGVGAAAVAVAAGRGGGGDATPDTQ